MSFTVFLLMQISPEADRPAEIVREVLTQTAARRGCKGVEVLIDDDDPLQWVAVERWASVDDRNAYTAWRETPEGANRLGEILAAPPVFRTFENTVSIG